MKLYAKPGFEWVAEECVGLFCPVLTGNTGFSLLDCNVTTTNDAAANGYSNAAQPWVGSEFGNVVNCDGINDFFSVGQVVRAMPFSISIWFWTRSTATVQSLFSIGSSTTANPLFQVALRGDLVADPVVAQMRGSNPTSNTFARCDGFKSNTWHHVVAVFRDSSYRQIWLDGVPGIADTTTFDTQPMNLQTICALRRTTTAQFFNGQIAECVIWERVLSQENVEVLKQAKPGELWQRSPVRKRSYFAEAFKIPNRRRASRFLGFPG